MKHSVLNNVFPRMSNPTVGFSMRMAPPTVLALFPEKISSVPLRRFICIQEKCKAHDLNQVVM